MAIRYQADMPSNIVEIVRPYLDEFSYLFPPWLQDLEVGFWYAETGFALEITVSERYRDALLKVGPKWLYAEPAMQRQMICHEIVHFLTIPLKTVALEAFEDLKAEEPVYSILCRKVDDVMEAVTQDFAYCIANK